MIHKKYPYEMNALTPGQMEELMSKGYNIKSASMIWREPVNVQKGHGLETASCKGWFITDKIALSLAETLNLLPKAIAPNGKVPKTDLEITKLDGCRWTIRYGLLYDIKADTLLQCAYRTLLWVESEDFKRHYIKRDRG